MREQHNDPTESWVEALLSRLVVGADVQGLLGSFRPSKVLLLWQVAHLLPLVCSVPARILTRLPKLAADQHVLTDHVNLLPVLGDKSRYTAAHDTPIALIDLVHISCCRACASGYKRKDRNMTELQLPVKKSSWVDPQAGLDLT